MALLCQQKGRGEQMKEVTPAALACAPQSGLQHDCRPHLVRSPGEEARRCERPLGQPRLTGSGHVLTLFFRPAFVSRALEAFLQPTALLEALSHSFGPHLNNNATRLVVICLLPSASSTGQRAYFCFTWAGTLVFCNL